MKWFCFEEKLPVLGSNILVLHESEKLVGIAEFTLEMRKSILNDGLNNGYQIDYYSDDPSDYCNFDVRKEDYWCYPSSIKKPKKK